MAEISRKEAMNQIGEWYGGFAEKPSEDAIRKAISDMEKLEAICGVLGGMFANDSMKIMQIEQILRG